MSRQQISVIIPAAGLSTRMGPRNKLLVRIGDMPIVEHVIRACQEQSLSRIIVVTGHEAELVCKVLAPYSVHVAHNTNYQKGMGSSLKCGIRQVESADGILIWPADMPFVEHKTVRKLIDAYNTESIIVPIFNGREGHPVLFGAQFKNDLLSIPEDEGARSVINKNPENVVFLPVTDPAVLRDIDTPEDLS